VIPTGGICDELLVYPWLSRIGAHVGSGIGLWKLMRKLFKDGADEN
jgi:hypothetical protein